MFERVKVESYPGILDDIYKVDDVGSPTKVFKNLDLTFDFLLLHRL